MTLIIRNSLMAVSEETNSADQTLRKARVILQEKGLYTISCEGRSIKPRSQANSDMRLNPRPITHL